MRKQLGRVIVGVLALVALSGCTTELEVHPQSDDGPAVEGLTYYLPATHFVIDVTRVLTRCETTPRTYAVEANVSLAVTEHSFPDPDHRYVIDYRSLNSAFKNTGLKVEKYDSGALKSLNASAADQTDRIVVGAVSAATKVALLASGVPISPASGPSPESNPDLCPAEVVAQIETARQSAATQKLETARLARLQRDLAAEQAARVPDASRLSELLAAIDAAAKAVEAQGKTNAAATAALTSRQSYRITPRAAALAFALAPSATALDRWFTAGGLRRLASIRGGDGVADGGGIPVPVELMVAVTLQPPAAAAPAARTAVSVTGLYYRESVPVLLRACVGTICPIVAPGAPPAPEAVRELLVTRVVAPQLGRLAVLPFRNGVLDDNVLKVTFSESGVLTSLEYATKSSAERAVAAGNDVLDVVAKQQDLRRKARLQDVEGDIARTKAQADLLDAQLAVARKQQELRALQGGE